MNQFKPQYPLIKTSASGCMNPKTGYTYNINEIEAMMPETIYYCLDPRDQTEKDLIEYGPKIGTTITMRSRLLDAINKAGDIAATAAVKLGYPIHWLLYSGPPGYITASCIAHILSVYPMDINYYLHISTRYAENEQNRIQAIKEWIAKQ